VRRSEIYKSFIWLSSRIFFSLFILGFPGLSYESKMFFYQYTNLWIIIWGQNYSSFMIPLCTKSIRSFKENQQWLTQCFLTFYNRSESGFVNGPFCRRFTGAIFLLCVLFLACNGIRFIFLTKDLLLCVLLQTEAIKCVLGAEHALFMRCGSLYASLKRHINVEKYINDEIISQVINLRKKMFIAFNQLFPLER
jgi:hypothetical protein